ncbi:MAG: two-component regulator propeller domain-containing protein [Vicingaceae bacterium]|nr:two-component regulator propeller domain-containing protein [Vicingaceae bacterium]
MSTFGFTQTYNFEYYNVEEGLSQSQVNSIIQDSRGHLWIGTQGGGACKFDGLTFTKFKEADGMSGDIVTDISEDTKGNIWFTTTWGGTTKYDGRKFLNYTTKDGLSNDGNNCIFTDKAGRVLIGNDNGLSIYSNGTIRNFTKENNDLNGETVNCITEDNNGNTWIGTNGGITIFFKDKKVFIDKRNGLISNNVLVIKQTSKGDFCIGTDKGLIMLLSGSVDDAKNYEFVETPLGKINIKVTDLLETKENEHWIATSENGIYIIYSNGEYTHLTKKNGLSTNSISSLYQDRSGNIWIGTNGGGLIKYGNRAFTYFNDVSGLNNNGVFSIIEDNDNNIWISTGDEGIYKYNYEESIHYDKSNGLKSNTVRSSVKDKKGDIWFATSNGLTKYSNGTFKTYTTTDGLPSNQIKVLLIDNDNNLWIGTSGGGLSRYNYKTFENFSGKTHKYVHSLFQDSKENIWIGTGMGVVKYSNEKFHSYVGAKGFCNNYVGSITEDKFGHLWFGTDRCVVRYDGLDFKSIGIENGLSSGVIYLLHADKNGHVWVGTNNGIDRITFDSYGQISTIKNYKSKQGFKGVECNSRAIFEDHNNNLWIGTVKGVVKYNPAEDKTNVFAPLTHINNIKLFFEDVDWLSYSRELYPWNNLPKNLSLEYDNNHLTFEFSAINLILPEEVQYRFKLENFDDKWYQTTNKTSATYSNLPYGDYIFKVIARNEDGVWNQEPATYSFSISSPWWKEWWAILLFLIVIFYTIYKVASFKEKRQREISKELEIKVKERTSLIETQRDEKEILLKEIHHRVKNNMQVIISLLSIQSGYTKDEAALALFDEAKNRIRSMALIHEKMYQTGDLARIDFQDYIMALTNDLIETYAINTDIFIDIKIDKVKFGIDTLIPLGLLLNEVISNTLKYAFKNRDKGRVIIHLLFNEETNLYTLIVGDNGIGMPPEMFDAEEGSLGMELIKIFTTQLDGDIERLPDEGTVFKITFAPRK